MKWLSGIAFVVQVSDAVIGSINSPDYYARSSESIRHWAFTDGLPFLLISVVAALAGLVAAFRIRRWPATTAAVISTIGGLAWLIQPLLYSQLGDLISWRFP